MAGRRSVFGTSLFLAALQLANSAPLSHGGTKTSFVDVAAEYDYVVVGGGTSGLVVANRLSADPGTTVLVVEYGEIDLGFEIGVPGMVMTAGGKDLLSFTSIPQVGVRNTTQGVVVGAVVGGGSQVNGMTFDRGSRSDYDSWEDLGNPGWNWDQMFKYFKKATTFTPPKPAILEKYHFTWDENTYGKDGPIQVGFPSWAWPDAYPEREAWINDLKVTNLSDHGAGGNNVGCAFIPTNLDPVNARRSTSRTGYYDPISNRTNLELLVRHYVSNIVFENKTAVGVNVVSRADRMNATVRARKEVILAAGALQTPKLLQLSGIGPSSLLNSLNISILEDLPGVGANFQDHPNMAVRMFFNNVSQLTPALMNNMTFYNASLNEYITNHTGPLTQATASNMVFLSLQDIRPDYKDVIASLEAQKAEGFLPDYYGSNAEVLAGFLAQRAVMAKHLLRQDAGVIEIPFAGSPGASMAIEKPLSRGTVMARSLNADPAQGPLIDFGVMRNPLDMQVAIGAWRKIRLWMSAPSLASKQPVELSSKTTDEEMEAIIRNSITASWAHPCCTAHMAPRNLGGVVDPQLRVYGVNKLRVVDASVMPLIPSCHLQSTVYAIAEKASDIIRGL